MKLPAKPPRRRNETRDLTHPIRSALNRLPGVQVWRNNTGCVDLATGGKIVYGLGSGSADLVGLVASHGLRLGRFFALEVKWPGKRPTKEQLAWSNVVRGMGGFAAVVTSVDEAIAAVERAMSGDIQ